MKQLVYNGDLIKESDFALKPDNRAFNYGDGLFETILVKNHEIFHASDHFERLNAGMEALQIHPSKKWNLSAFKDCISQLVKINYPSGTSRIKIQVWRRPGGLFSPEQSDFDFLISSSDFHSAPEKKNTVAFYDKVRINPSPYSRFKTLNCLPYILASIERKKSRRDDLILADIHGNISECTSSNIFFVKEKTLHTPSLDTGCIEGIIRKQILNFCNHHKIEVAEGKFKKEELLKADYSFTSNITGLSLIESIEGKPFYGKTEILDLLRKNLNF